MQLRFVLCHSSASVCIGHRKVGLLRAHSPASVVKWKAMKTARHATRSLPRTHRGCHESAVGRSMHATNSSDMHDVCPTGGRKRLSREGAHRRSNRAGLTTKRKHHLKHVLLRRMTSLCLSCCSNSGRQVNNMPFRDQVP